MRDLAAELQRAAATSRERQPQATRADAQQGPPDEGFAAATLQRSEDEQLRVRVSRFNGGAPYLSLRVWTKNSSGAWWPSKTKGLTVKLRELGDLAEGLIKAMAEADRLRAEYRAQQQAEPQRQQPQGKGRWPR